MHHVFVGFRCNNRCRFCAQGDLRSRELTDLVEEDLRRIPPGSVVAIVGGEPTLHDELPRWIERARLRGARMVLVQTNGRRLAEAGYPSLLRDSGLQRLDVSLHGSTSPMHDFHTGAPRSFSQTTRGLWQARAQGLETAVTTVVTRSNYRHLAEIARLSHGLGARALHLSVTQPLGAAALRSASLLPPRGLLRPHWVRALATARALGLPCLAGRSGGTARGGAEEEEAEQDGGGPDDGVRERFAGLGVVSRPGGEKARA